MRTFSGRLWLAQDRYSELGVQIRLDEERITITSNGSVIGDWSFDDVSVRKDADGIHLFAEDEELVIASRDPGFNRAMLRPVVFDLTESTDEQVSPVTRLLRSEDAGAETVDEDREADDESPRKRSRKGAHREPWSLKLRW